MPRATAMPWTLKVMRGRPGSFAFAELVVDEGQQGRHRLLLALAAGLQRDFRAQAGGQHHHAHDALGVDAPLAAADPHLAGKAAAQLGELGGGASTPRASWA